MTDKTWFERAIFLSWYCSKADCAFCYMSTQKPLIKDPKKARRTRESILAEALLCRIFGWKIEFLSSGIEAYTIEEFVDITKKAYEITGQKQWLNLGVLDRENLHMFLPYIEGVAGTIECINEEVRNKVCPSKPIKPIIEMFKAAEQLGIKKCITIIIGLGETEKDIPKLLDFIEENKIDKITFYALKPQKGTYFKKGPEKDYYVRWIRKTRDKFPDIAITAGSWIDRLDEIHLLLEAGADAITKFPSIKLFGSKYAKQIEEEAGKAGRKFEGTLTDTSTIQNIDLDKELGRPGLKQLDNDLREKIKQKAEGYLKAVKK